jgi:hypothetical protein
MLTACATPPALRALYLGCTEPVLHEISEELGVGDREEDEKGPAEWRMLFLDVSAHDVFELRLVNFDKNSPDQEPSQDAELFVILSTS